MLAIANAKNRTLFYFFIFHYFDFLEAQIRKRKDDQRN